MIVNILSFITFIAQYHVIIIIGCAIAMCICFYYELEELAMFFIIVGIFCLIIPALVGAGNNSSNLLSNCYRYTY